MIGDLFDSPWKILIVAAVIIVLFGSAKLPAAARSLGKSMRILKTEVSGLHNDDEPASVTPPPSTAEQLAAAERQLAAVRRLHAAESLPGAQPAAQPAPQRG